MDFLIRDPETSDFKGPRYFHPRHTILLHLFQNTHCEDVKLYSLRGKLITWGTILIIPFMRWAVSSLHTQLKTVLVGLDDQNWLFDVYNFKKSNISCVWQIQQKGGLSAGVFLCVVWFLLPSFWLEWLSHQYLISVSRTLSVFSDFLLWPSRNIADSHGYSPLYLWGTLKKLC